MKFRGILSSVLSLVLILLFQNCGEDFDESSGVNNYVENELPFAFDFEIDQISYMSCNGSALDADNRYFSFKAGAFGADSGVFIRDGYRAKSLEAQFTNKEAADALDISRWNAGSGLVLALRNNGNLQSTIGTTDKTISGLSFDRAANLSLTQTDIAEQLINPTAGTRINSFALPGLDDNRSLDAQISFGINELDTNLIRQRLSSNEYLLTLTYATESAENDSFPGQRARSPYDVTGTQTDSGNYVFGKAYNFEFYQYDPFRTGSQSRAITRVSRATNLENRSSMNEDWVCPDDEKYIIVRQGDALRGFSGGASIVKINQTGAAITPNSYQFKIGAGTTIAPGEAYVENVVCPMYPDDVSSNVEVSNKWRRVRNMLPHKDWYVFRGVENGGNYNCIVPKSAGNCYGEANQNTNPNIVVQYLANEDFPSYPSADRPSLGSNCGSGTQKYCPHILSICYKR